jgi:hypothetical protein
MIVIMPLSIGDFGLPAIAVLGDQVAGEAGQVVVANISDATLPDLDHFAGADKMMVAVQL